MNDTSAIPQNPQPLLSEDELKTHGVLRSSKELYTMISLCTRMPFVHCDPETLDDEIFLYTDAETAKAACAELLKAGNPLQPARLENEQLRFFYTTLYSMGINALALNWNTEHAASLQLSSLIRRPDPSALPKDAVIVENPELMLTAMYLLQETRRQGKPDMTPQLQALHEEMLADFQRGSYIVVRSEDNQVPLIKQPNGEQYFPIFSDLLEFGKFNRENRLKPVVVKFQALYSIITPLQAAGVVLNPFGLNLPLKITANAPAKQSVPSAAAMADAAISAAAQAQENTNVADDAL